MLASVIWPTWQCESQDSELEKSMDSIVNGHGLNLDSAYYHLMTLGKDIHQLELKIFLKLENILQSCDEDVIRYLCKSF